MIHNGAATRRSPMGYTAALHEWRRIAEAAGHEVIESVAAQAQLAGPTMQPVYDTLSGRICDDLRAAGHVSIVLLMLHGAMIAEHTIDREGDLLSRIREIAGAQVVFGSVFDPHAHLIHAIMDAADLFNLFKRKNVSRSWNGAGFNASACATLQLRLQMQDYATSWVLH